MDDLIYYAFPFLVLLWLFVMGCAVGSFLNVCLYRLPRGKNLLWPSSRCGVCLRAIPLYHNIPLVSWWWLRGRCGSCGTPFSMRYFWVELLTGLVVVGLYCLEVGLNIHGLPVWGRGGFEYLFWGHFPPQAGVFIAFHTVLAALLIVAAGCLLEQGALPRALVVSGAVLGLVWSLLCPWPEPMWPALAPVTCSRSGFVPWPVWEPLPAWLPPGSLVLGLASAAAGILGPAWLVRLAGWGARRITGRASDCPALPGLLMMTGGFLGWQPLVVALALAVLLALPLRLVVRLPGRPLALLLVVGLVAAWLGWGWLGPVVRPWLFDPVWLAVCLVGLGGLLPVAMQEGVG